MSRLYDSIALKLESNGPLVLFPGYGEVRVENLGCFMFIFTSKRESFRTNEFLIFPVRATYNAVAYAAHAIATSSLYTEWICN